MLTGILKGTLLCCESDNFTQDSAIDTDEEILRGSAFLLRILYKIVIPIILTGGIIGNILILIVLSTPLFRGIAYLYLSGLAWAHLGVLISWIPISFRLGYGMRHNYPSVFYHAHLELVTVNTFAIASTLIMTCLIVDRYTFIFFPTRIRGGNVRKNVHSFILCSFILGFSTSAPLTGMRMVYEQQNDTTTIFTLRENTFITQSTLWSIYIWSMNIVLRICPTIIFTFLNCFVLKRFLQLDAKKKQFQSVSEKFRTANVIDTSLSALNRGFREEQHLAVLTTVMAFCFIVTMIPSILLSLLYQKVVHTDNGYRIFRSLSATVELCNFTVYIVIYLSCSKEFRRELFKIVQGKRRKHADEDLDQPIGEIEDYSRHGTTVRLTPEHTKLNSPGSPNKLNTMDEDKESELLSADEV